MLNTSVLFHCNVDTTTGFGHFMRCLALAEEALAQGWNVSFTGRLSTSARAAASALIPEAKIEHFGSENTVAELERIAAAVAPSVLHIDSYSADLDTITAPADLLSNAQDGTFGRRPADLIIDANLFAEERYTSPSPAAALLGAEAMQIRAQVRAIRHSVRDPHGRPLRILLILGGTDPHNHTPTVARMLSSQGRQIELTVVCREVQHDEVRAQLKGLNVKLSLLAFTNSLPALADKHDLAVTGAGTSTWDFAAMGIPMALLNIVENHRDGYEAAIRADIALQLGAPDAPGFEALTSAAVESAHDVRNLRALAAQGRAYIDGLGCWRIISTWNQMLHSPARLPKRPDTVSTRAVVMDDAATLFRWRNDPSTRSTSRHPEPVLWEDHLSWLESTLQNPNRRLLIAEYRNQSIGTARWDRKGEYGWEASITVAPEVRGKGLASSILAAAEQELPFDSPVQLIAVIHTANLPSRKLFAGAGYLPYAPADAQGFGTFAKWRLKSDPM